ncbi:MAG: carboxypeptidase-like regulatory domain-containing protein [Polyangiaceae bacterium]
MPPPAPSVEAIINPQHLSPYTGPTGSIEGTISVTGDPPTDTKVDVGKCPAAASIYGKAFREGAKLEDGSRALADALVAVTEYPGGYVQEKLAARRVSIHDCAFETRTIDMTFGQKLEVANRDAKGFYAPVLSLSPTPAVMVPPPNGDPISLYPEKPGYGTVSDRMGSPLYADVYVLLQPLHAVSDLSGHFRIDGVPVGKSKLSARLRTINNDASKAIEVHDGVVERIDLVLNFDKNTAPTSVKPDAGPIKPNIR